MENIIFKVSKENILNNLVKVSKALKDKSVLPIYGYILCEVYDNILNMTGTDTRMQIDSSVEILETSGNMSFCVDKSIIDILKTLPDQPLTIEVTKEELPEMKTIKVNVTIIHSSGSVVINGDDSQYFTKMKDVDSDGFDVKAFNLKRGLDKTKKFALNDSMKPVVSSVFFDTQDDSLTFVASDNRVASRFIDYSIKCQNVTPFILDINSANTLSALLTGINDADVTIRICGNNVSFSVNGLKFTSRLVEGKYINYNKVYRENLPIQLRADSKHLFKVINRLINASDRVSSLIRMEAGLMQTQLFTKDIMFGKSADELIECECNGEIVIGMHGKMLQEMLSVIDGGIVLSFFDSSSPIQLTPADQEHETNLTILVMPLSLE